MFYKREIKFYLYFSRSLINALLFGLWEDISRPQVFLKYSIRLSQPCNVFQMWLAVVNARVVVLLMLVMSVKNSVIFFGTSGNTKFVSSEILKLNSVGECSDSLL